MGSRPRGNLPLFVLKINWDFPPLSIFQVTCRAIGIGSYVVRLGQRICQVENSHIILTGAAALNKVLGQEVYTSNSQLGGIQIMHNNGVTHAVSRDDFDGVGTLLKWLSYMPKVSVPCLSLSNFFAISQSCKVCKLCSWTN